MSTLSCPHCRKTLKTKAEIPAGKKVKCPACSEIFQASAAAPARVRAAEAVTSGPAKDRSAPRKRPLDDDSEEEPKPRRSKKKKKAASGQGLLLTLCGVGLLVVTLGVTGFVWPAFLMGSKKTIASPPPVQASGETRKIDPRPEQESEKDVPSGGNANVANASGGNLSVRAIMTRLTKGPQSLGSTIGNELKGDAPAWDALQEQTKEYLDLAKAMSAQGPPRGSKESWTTLTTAFAETAQNLDQSVRAKNKEAAITSHELLSSSCMACHQAHRGGQKGFSPKGGFGGKGGFGPKKGPPPENPS